MAATARLSAVAGHLMPPRQHQRPAPLETTFAPAALLPTPLSANPSAAAAAPPAAAHTDLVYKEDGDRKLMLDVYIPRDAEGPVPLVMWVYGGGWRNGDFKNAPTWLCKYGIAVASIEQRPIMETGWPAQIDDPRDALAYLRTQASELGIDPERFGVFGGSSGGHLVALLGTTSTKINIPESAVQAVCDWFGPTDLLAMPPNTLGFGKDIGRARTLEDLSTSNGAVMLETLLKLNRRSINRRVVLTKVHFSGATVRDVPELAKSASAFWQADETSVPFLFMHGDQDFGVPMEQTAKLHAKLLAAGVQSQMHVLEGAGHGGPEFNTEEMHAKVANFFKDTM